jgi:ATPase complex subunit ATP10
MGLSLTTKRANEMFKPYFRDFSRLSKEFKGKSWIAPPQLFKAEKALFFPNMMGRTLATSDRVNTTHTLFGNVSVVAVFATRWAENQVKTFLDQIGDEVPELKENEENSEEEGLYIGGQVQRVDVNIEENWAKAALIKMFIPSLQSKLPLKRHSRYFMINKGISSDMKHSMGLWNGKVGYVYLVDWNCRIRWAGSGNAEPEERTALIKGFRKLAEDLQTKRSKIIVS